MHFNDKNNGWVTKKFLDEVIQINKKGDKLNE